MRNTRRLLPRPRSARIPALRFRVTQLRPCDPRHATMWVLPALVAAPMLLVAELTGRHELLFPEGIALAFGVCVLQRPELMVSPVRLVLMPPVCGGIGVVVVASQLPQWAGCLTALTLSVGLLQAFRCQIAPAVSAAVLPVVFQVGGWMYIVSVFAISAVVAALGARKSTRSVEPSSVRRWSWHLLGLYWLAAAAWIVLGIAVLRLPSMALAPPLLVSCLDWVMSQTKTVDVAVRRCGLLTAAGTLGASASRWIPLEWIAGITAVVVVLLLVMLVAEHHFPVVAVALVPFVARQSNPLIAGGAVALGSVVLHVAGCAAVALGARIAPSPSEEVGGLALDVGGTAAAP